VHRPDGATIADRLLFALAALAAELKRELISEYTVDGLRTAAAAGQHPWRPPARRRLSALHRHQGLIVIRQLTSDGKRCRYGGACATAWDRLHPRLTRRAAWLDYDGDLPVMQGTLIRLVVDHLPGDGDPKPVWLWSSRVGASPSHVDRLWQTFLRRFDLEHTFDLQAYPRLDRAEAA
jgi:hypothetical protein